MSRFIATLVVATSLLTSVQAASAAPLGGEAARTGAQFGFITVGGAFDAR